MKTIAQYIEGVSPGEPLPSIKGIIRKITPPDDTKETQIITLGDEKGDSIKVHIKDKALYVVHPKVDNILSLTLVKEKKAASTGMILKENSKNKILYITVTGGVLIQQESVTEKEEEEPEPLTAADSAIDNYVLDRLYIFKRTKAVVEESDIPYSTDKIAELATAVHIELSRKNISPRPTDQQLERKSVHANRKEKAAPVEPTKSSLHFGESGFIGANGRAGTVAVGAWKEFRHPKSGVPLGSESFEKIKTHYGPWVLRVKPESLEPAARELYDHICAALKELKITPSESLEAYTAKYIEDYEPHSPKRRNELTIKFAEGLESAGKTKKNMLDAGPTDKEATYILQHFSSLWKEIIENETE